MSRERLAISITAASCDASDTNASLSCPSAEFNRQCSASHATCIVGFGLNASNEHVDAPLWGAVLGCDDGSAFIFHNERDASSPQLLSPSTALGARPSPVSAHFQSLPPPAAHDHLITHERKASNPFALQNTRSTVVSGLSKEQVEAPKNYVDFDNEPEKLAAMLQSKSSKNSPSSPYQKLPGGGAQPHTNGSQWSLDDSTALLAPHLSTRTSSARTSRATSPFPHRSLSTSQLPSIAPKVHVFPPRTARGHRITAMQVIEDDQTVVTLHESGTVSLFSALDGKCVASLHIPAAARLQPPSGIQGTNALLGAWSWTSLHVVCVGEHNLFVTCASETWTLSSCDPAADGPKAARTRVAVTRCPNARDREYCPHSERLELVGEWVFESSFQSIGLFLDREGQATLHYLDAKAQLVTQSLRIVPIAQLTAQQTLAPSVPQLEATTAAPSVTASPMLGPIVGPIVGPISLNLPPIANPFKHFKALHAAGTATPVELSSDAANDAKPGRVEVGEQRDLGYVRASAADDISDRCARGSGVTVIGETLLAAVWFDDATFVLRQTALNAQARWAPVPLISQLVSGVQWLDEQSFAATLPDRVVVYRTSFGGSPSDQQPPTVSLNSEIVSCIDLAKTDMSTIMTSSPDAEAEAGQPVVLLATRVGSDGGRRLYAADITVSNPRVSTGVNGKAALGSTKKSKLRSVWKSPPSAPLSNPSALRITAILPVELQSIVVGYGCGALRRKTFAEFITPRRSNGDAELAAQSTDCQESMLDEDITSLDLVQTDKPNRLHVIGGTSSGAVVVWDYPSLQLRARWAVFATPLQRVISLLGEHVGQLRGNVLCVADDGTIAVMSMESLSCSFVIPGSPAQLNRISLAEDNLLLFYADGRTRLWDVKTLEFWRSMDSRKAHELLSHGDWFDVHLDADDLKAASKMLSTLGLSVNCPNAASTIVLDLRMLNDITSPPSASFSFTKPSSGLVSRDEHHSVDGLPPDVDSTTSRSPQQMQVIKSILPSLLSFGMNTEVDWFLSEKLGINQSSVPTSSVGFCSEQGAVSVFAPCSSTEVWQISPQYTAARLLATVMLLRAGLGFSEWEKDVSNVIAFYVVSLPDLVSSHFQPPCLAFLSQFWFDSSPELRQASRILFESAASRMSDREAIAFVEHWRHHLPCLQPDSQQQGPYASRALLVAAHVAVERYSLLSTSTLTDIAKSVTMYLHDESSIHRILAIELCSKGFQIWQHYVDAMEMLRSLITIATNMRKDFMILSRNAPPHARLAILQIASTNTPLFMTTLSLDILKPRTVEHRKSIMQLVAFFIRKKPLVLYPNLPRLVEAVVKSLDPNNSADREAVQDSATQILGQVVKTFPTVDFHMSTQRLAVGTTEGAVVMYDLKTGTRLYVLEGHKKRLAACSFSPDGRRLTTVSLEESVVMVWKVGTSFSSFFNPGAPPRQGSSGSAPFKTLSFNVGDEARMTVASTLDWVGFEWPAERSARLKIRDSTLTFTT